MKRMIRVGDLKKLLENALSEAPRTVEKLPPELSAIQRTIPGLKIKPTGDQRWGGVIKVSEKKRPEQLKMTNAWARVIKLLNSRPWKKNSAEEGGYNAQFDTGGNWKSNNMEFVHPSGLVVKLYYGNSFGTGTKTWQITAWMPAVSEGLLREDDSAELKEEGNDSLDSQVDRFLGQYEGEAKSAKAEGRDFRMLTRRILGEAGEDETAGDDAGDDEAADAVEPAKMSINDIDIDSFANSVVRLVENYDSLLEVRSTMARRAINFIAKSYEPEVVEALKQTLRDDHGLVPGESEDVASDDRFPAPSADRAGDGGAGGAA